MISSRLLVEGSELKAIYDRRPLIETVNFMVKAHAGSHVLSKSNSTKTAQTLCKVQYPIIIAWMGDTPRDRVFEVLGGTNSAYVLILT